MKNNLTNNMGLIALLIVAVFLIVISFLLVGSFNLFAPVPTPEVYVDPETGSESYYDPSYYTEEDIKKIRESMDHSDIPEETPTTPVP